MRFSLIPREMKFFDFFDEVAVVISRAAGKFLDMLTNFDSLPARGIDIKKDEEDCDAIIERMLKALDRTFITPIDREDIHTLATTMDDIMDNLEETAHRFEVFRIDKPTRAAIQLARIIKDCTDHLEHAIKQLRNMKRPEEIHHHVLEISRLENEADQLYREVDAALFDNGGQSDILTLIKWRELYAWLEETVDSCKDVANTISEIVIKGS
jgi:predicted phosphate transport protein (TIGR00153 family)